MSKHTDETEEEKKRIAAKAEIKNKEMANIEAHKLKDHANKEHFAHAHQHSEEEEEEERKESRREALEKGLVLGAMALAFVATVVTGGIAPLVVAAAAATMNILAIPLKRKINDNIKGHHRNMVKATLVSNTVRRGLEFTEAVSDLGKHAFMLGAVASVFEAIALPLAGFALIASVISFSTAIIAHKKNPNLANKCAIAGTSMVMLASGASLGLGIAAVASTAALAAIPIAGPIIASVILTATLIKSAPYIHNFFKKNIAPKFKSLFNSKPKEAPEPLKETEKLTEENVETLEDTVINTIDETETLNHKENLEIQISTPSPRARALSAHLNDELTELGESRKSHLEVLHEKELSHSAPADRIKTKNELKEIEGILMDKQSPQQSIKSAPASITVKHDVDETHHHGPKEH